MGALSRSMERKHKLEHHPSSPLLEPYKLEDKADQLDENQARALDRMAEPDSADIFVAWWKMGTGKTRLAIHAFYRSGMNDCIVVCRRISFDDWIEEIVRCQMHFLIFVNNYRWENCKYFPKSIPGQKPQRLLLVSAGDLKSIPPYFPKGEMIVVDELYLFGNPKSKRSILLKTISLFCRARIGLSGTIMPARDVMTIFGQLSALNAHQPLARTTTEFRSKFQVKGRGRFGIEFIDIPGAKDKIVSLIADRVDIHFPESRPTRIQIIKVEKTTEQAKAISGAKELFEFNGKEYDHAIQIVNLVNGISNGWWVKPNGDLEHYKSTKVEKLLAIVDELVAAGERVVIWCAYHNDIARISADLKHRWLEFTARIPFDRTKWESGSYPVVLATEANGASVNHFKHVKYAIYFSINYKLLDLEQSMARHERKGSTHDGAHYYFLQTKGTTDARTYQLVTESKASEQELITTLYKELYQQ